MKDHARTALRFVIALAAAIAVIVFALSAFILIYFAGFATCTDTADCKDVGSVVYIMSIFTAASAGVALLLVLLARRR